MLVVQILSVHRANPAKADFVRRFIRASVLTSKSDYKSFGLQEKLEISGYICREDDTALMGHLRTIGSSSVRELDALFESAKGYSTISDDMLSEGNADRPSSCGVFLLHMIYRSNIASRGGAIPPFLPVLYEEYSFMKYKYQGDRSKAYIEYLRTQFQDSRIEINTGEFAIDIDSILSLPVPIFK